MSHFSKVTLRGRSHADFIDSECKSGVGLGEQTFLTGRVGLCFSQGSLVWGSG